MNFTINAKNLTQILTKLNKTIAAKNAVAILDNFRIELSGRNVSVRASSADSTCISAIEAVESDGNGVFCVNASRLTALMKSLGDIPVSITYDSDRLEIKSASGHYKLGAVDATVYPIQEQAAGESILIPAQAFVTGLEKTKWAVGKDEIRPHMSGVLVDLHNDNITLASTDTRKLCRYTISNATGKEGRFILPLKTVELIISMFDKSDNVALTYSPAAITLSDESTTLTSNLLRGNFPDYNRVIPQESAMNICVDRQAMIAALNRITAFAEDRLGLVTVKALMGCETLDAEAVDANSALSAKESVACSFNGQDVRIGFAGEYLKQVLSALSDESVTIQISNPARPVRVDESGEGTEMTIILMPMTIPQ